ncbi:hypothetical protein BOTBODRAFT_259741 [Botryobasidium botryosum FD-172 SS1]|uniref:Uncharacterized protein n=1 Tax=Botryobasidium botryosum (strain FD-172 SS1) TaxID=930990 RepID=A0A067MKP5_BOTB1|nr:hypothetical protein BOTBODRAFT_259741 [Botryobasidium botryosum FD-172 SS1]
MQRVMPWLAMAESPQPPSTSIELDYQDHLAPLVPFRAVKNKHWPVAASSVAALCALLFSPVMGPVMSLQLTIIDQMELVTKSSQPGLVHWYNDLEGFYAAMTDTSSAMRSGVNGLPSSSAWVPNTGWTVGAFTTNSSIAGAAVTAIQQQYLLPPSISATVSAVQSFAGCESTNLTVTSDGSMNYGVTAIGSETGCTYKFILSLNTLCYDSKGDNCCDNWGGDVTPCGRTQPNGQPLDPSQQSFVFWTGRMVSLDAKFKPNASVTICTPKYVLWRGVNALIDATTHAVLDLIPPATPPDPMLQIDPLFNYSKFNGYALDYFYNGTGAIELNRRSAIQMGLLSAIVTQGETWPYSAYLNDSYTFITANVYLRYLALVAREVYFTEQSSTFPDTANSGNVTIHMPQVRLFVNTLAASFATGILVIILICLLTVTYFVWKTRHLSIPREEGRIATSIIAGAAVAGILEESADQIQGPGRFRNMMFWANWNSNTQGVPSIVVENMGGLAPANIPGPVFELGQLQGGV